MTQKNQLGLLAISIFLTAGITWIVAKNHYNPAVQKTKSDKVASLEEVPFKENEDPVEIPDGLKDVVTKDLTEGHGKEVDVGSLVEINYVGRLHSGKIIDSSRRRFKSYSFRTGHGETLPGLEMGVLGMKEGGKRRLIIPPQFGYGPKGTSNGFVPGNATLVYDVEVLKVSR